MIQLNTMNVDEIDGIDGEPDDSKLGHALELVAALGNCLTASKDRWCRRHVLLAVFQTGGLKK